MKHRFITLLFAIMASVGTIFAESGTCGENLTWDLSFGVLTIRGTGAMTNYVGDDYRHRAPWFNYRSSIKTIIIGDSVTTIGNWAFMSCDNLTSVTIGSNVTRIGHHGVYGCTSLPSVTIPNGVTSIESSAFSGCSSLTSVTIPSSVESIDIMAFNCSTLTSVTNYSIRPQSIQSSVFSYVDLPFATLYVPAQGIEEYKSVDPWKNFGTIKTIENQIEIEETNANIVYVAQDTKELFSELITFHVPIAPTIDGFIFIEWQVVAGSLKEGITIQAVYKADEVTSAPDVYTNPANPAQKLVRNGNVYILTGEKVYTVTGQEVR